MSMNVQTMIFDIIAKDRAGTTFNRLGREAEGAGNKTHKFGKVAGVALAGAAVAVAAFGKKSVEAYSDAAKETMQLARVTGMTTKAASQLRFAAEESGVEFSTLSTSTRIFSKNLAGADTSAKKTADMAALLGTGWKDAHGNLIPMNELLPKVADHFKQMPDGPTKTAAAMKLFGRSGADMIKILNKGSDGLAELAKESDRTGNTIGNTDNLKKQIQAQREFHAAITGLMITIGQSLTPVITALSLYMTQHVAPAFTSVTHFVQQNHDIISKIAPVVLGLVVGLVALVKITKAFTAVQTALDVVLNANPIGLVVLAIAALAAGLIYAYKHSETFRKVVDAAFKGIAAVAKWLWESVFRPYFKLIIGLWLAVVGAIVNGAAKAFGWVPGLGPKLKTAAAWFNSFKKDVNNQLDGIKDKKVKVSVDTGRSFRDLNNIKQVMADIKSKKVFLTVNTTNDLAKPTPRKHGAVGGRFGAFQPLTLGETGTEQVMFDRPSMVVPHNQLGGSGGNVYIDVRVEGGLDSAPTIATRVEAALRQLKKGRGWQPLEFERDHP